MTTKLFFFDVLFGFFDADGSFEAKVYFGTVKPVSFHLNIIFPQKDKTVLEMILKTLGFPPDTFLSSCEHNLASGTKTTSWRKSIGFSTKAGQDLLVRWEKIPPKAPTKFLDFQICRVLAQVNTDSAVTVVNKFCQHEIVDSERIASFALLHLRYKMFGKVKANSNPNLIPIKTHYGQLKATQAEIEQATRAGEIMFAKIKLFCDENFQNLKIQNEGYFLGYHIGDGSFYFSTNFGKNGKSFKAQFGWNLTDCIEHKPLLEASKQFLESKNSILTKCALRKDQNSARLQLTRMSELSKLIRWFEQWEAHKVLPQQRLCQYKCFVEALDLYLDPSFRDDFEKCSRFIHLKWMMNSSTNSKKKGSLETDMIQLEKWFMNKTKGQ